MELEVASLKILVWIYC